VALDRGCDLRVGGLAKDGESLSRPILRRLATEEKVSAVVPDRILNRSSGGLGQPGVGFI
jgi:hypothetical protein